MTTIVFAGEDRAIPVADPAMTILDVSIAHKIAHVRACGGHGRCTTCRVRICEGIQNVSARTPREVELAEALRWDGSTPLACQTHVSGDVTVERLIKSPADMSCLQLEGAAISPPQERTLAILFSDIRNFTPFVETHLVYDVVHILNPRCWCSRPSAFCCRIRNASRRNSIDVCSRWLLQPKRSSRVTWTLRARCSRTWCSFSSTP
jgi:ferredoxin